MKFTNVFIEDTPEAAQARLEHLRKVDRYHEIKAYIIPEGDKFRVCRKIDIDIPLPTRKTTRNR